MPKLTKHQERALKLFPDEGWHRVDNVPSFWLWIIHREATARKLEEKGYLEGKLFGYVLGNIWSGDIKYSKVIVARKIKIGDEVK